MQASVSHLPLPFADLPVARHETGNSGPRRFPVSLAEFVHHENPLPLVVDLLCPNPFSIDRDFVALINFSLKERNQLAAHWQPILLGSLKKEHLSLVLVYNTLVSPERGDQQVQMLL